MGSSERIRLEVTTTDRFVAQDTSAQKGISSMMGLIIATSGCPHTAFLRPMARFHQPLAGELDLGAALKDKISALRSRKNKPLDRPNRVVIDNESSSFFTIIEVFTYDFPGLLFSLTEVVPSGLLDNAPMEAYVNQMLTLAGLGQAAFIAGSALFLSFQAIDRLLEPVPLERLGLGIWVMVFLAPRRLASSEARILVSSSLVKVTTRSMS